jgi:hypothetical protein
MMGKRYFINKCCYENWVSTSTELKLDPCLSPYSNINSKWIKDLNIRSETLKQLLKVVGNTLEHTDTGNNFLNRTPMA